MRRVPAAVLALLVFAGCDDATLSWEVRFADATLRARAVRVHTSIRRGGCAGDETDVVYAGDAQPGLPAPSVPDLGPGRWGFAAFAVDASCRRFAAGCTGLELPTEQAAVVTTLEAEPEIERCDLAECMDGFCEGERLDAGTDAGGADGGGDAGDASDGGIDAGASDAGDGDAGDTDAGGVDAGGTDAGPPTGCGGRLFCDDFETGDTRRWTRAVARSPSTVDVVASPVHGGSRALRAIGGLNQEQGMLEAEVFPASATDYYLRAWIRLDAAASHGAQFIGFRSSTGADMIGVQSGSSASRVIADITLGTGFNESFPPVSIGVWTCFELHVRVGNPGRIELWRDEVAVPIPGRVDTRPDAGFDLRVAAVGVLFKTRTNSAKIIYVDDVVADTSRIGCSGP